MQQLSIFEDEPAADENAEYRAFTDKFKPKLTTDDCLTPGPIYEAVKTWACLEYGINPEDIVRPFWPGADYQSAEYKPGAVVLDNPPFSILTSICRWYEERSIRYFLFAPTLTLFSGQTAGAKLPCGVSITYANGARVNTSFVTSLEPPDTLVRTVPTLFAALRRAEAENQTQLHGTRAQYDYPPEVVTAPMLSTLTKHGQALTIRRDEAHFCRALDAQRAHKKQLFGAGYILGTEATKRTAAATRAAETAPIYCPGIDAPAMTWALSERERDIIRQLDGQADLLPIERAL